MTPKLSIIIPTLNEELYLPKLLTALEKQTFKDFEVIVVDGRSEDKTKIAAQFYKNRLPGLKVLESEVRRPSVQRNKGAKEAGAENLLFLDADTLPSPAYLEKLLRLVEKEKATAAICWLKPFSENWFDKTFYPLINFLGFELSLKFFPLSTTANLFVRKKIFKRLKGFDEKMSVSEDNDFARRVLKAGLRYKVLRSPKIFFSTRRFKKEGRAGYIFTCLKVFLLSALLGPEKGQALAGYGYGQFKAPPIKN